MFCWYSQICSRRLQVYYGSAGLCIFVALRQEFIDFFLEILYLRCEEKPRFSEKRMLSRNAHYKEVNTKHPDFVLSSADTSIKVTVLPLTLANMHFLHGSKLKMLCATTTNFRIRALFLETPQLWYPLSW